MYVWPSCGLDHTIALAVAATAEVATMIWDDPSPLSFQCSSVPGWMRFAAKRSMFWLWVGQALYHGRFLYIDYIDPPLPVWPNKTAKINENSLVYPFFQTKFFLYNSSPHARQEGEVLISYFCVLLCVCLLRLTPQPAILVLQLIFRFLQCKYSSYFGSDCYIFLFTSFITTASLKPPTLFVLYVWTMGKQICSSGSLAKQKSRI